MSGNTPGDGNQPSKNPTPPSTPRTSGARREKDLARLKAERQAARRAEREKKQRMQAIWGGVIAVVVIAAIVGLVWWAPWNNGSNTVTPTPSATPTIATPTPTPTQAHVAGCTTAPAIRADNISYKTPPTASGSLGAYMNLNTNCGLIQIKTDPKSAPGVTSSMLGLTHAGFFNLTKCHRLTTSGIYVLQCGDPKGDGTGGPGYTIKDEPSAFPKAGNNNYPAGTVAMANAGANTTGSQFFIVYKNTTLSPNYMIFGTVTQGLSQVQAVAAAGVAGGGTDGAPAQPVVIKTATVSTK